eukprot:SAG22_NODE_1_length_62449_cov_158.689270_59_plen_133_part_00
MLLEKRGLQQRKECCLRREGCSKLTVSPLLPRLDAYAKGVDRFIKRAKAAGVKAYFFVDLIVLPTTVLALWPNATCTPGAAGCKANTGPNTGGIQQGSVQWNAATRQLMKVLCWGRYCRSHESSSHSYCSSL